jgi:transcriptional regulator with XRE-family HTH domain
MDPFGELVRRRRSEIGLSQSDLAHAVGVHPRQLRRYESGEQQPALAVAVRIAQTLGASLDELAGTRLGLEGSWWAAWQLPGDVVATLPLTLRRRGPVVELEALERRGHTWRGELRAWEDGLLTGWYDSAEGRVRSRGTLLLVLRDGWAEGRWTGRSGAGPVSGSHAALAAAREEARAIVARLAAG